MLLLFQDKEDVPRLSPDFIDDLHINDELKDDLKNSLDDCLDFGVSFILYPFMIIIYNKYILFKQFSYFQCFKIMILIV